MRPPCEHGEPRETGHSEPILWNGPVGRCGCCLSAFFYVDSGGSGVTADGHHSSYSRYWYPLNRCGPCGGGYRESRSEWDDRRRNEAMV